MSTTASKLTIQPEKLADDIKREALREQWRALSDTLPDVLELNENEILAEVKTARTERKAH